ncbi:MAG: FecR domain-containing protein [Polyangiaceae bacterium]
MADRDLEQMMGSWRQSVIPVEDAETLRSRRSGSVPNIARAIREENEQRVARRRRKTAAFAVLCAAALVIAFLAIRGLSPSTTELASVGEVRGDVVVIHSGSESVIKGPQSHQTAVGDGLSTLAGRSAHLTLQGGASVELGGSSTLYLDAIEANLTRLRLDAGRVRVKVPKLGTGRFEVVTPDTVVTVHGTEFTVIVDAEGHTEVVVHQGRVGVSSKSQHAMLTPQAVKVWRSTGTPTAAAPETNAPAAPAEGTTTTKPGARVQAPAGGARPKATQPVAPTQAAAPTQPTAPSPQESTSLAEQNRIYAAALAARDRGDDAKAIARLDELLRRYPTGPLAPEARVERFRALKRLGKDREASTEARKYLQVAPTGAARDEARDIAIPSR